MADVRISGLHKRYGEFHAVRGLDLTIEQGEVLCLLGPSGCGKTTTLRMVAGLEVPTGGQISIGGRVVSDAGTWVPPEDRRLGMVFQSYAVWPHMDVLANVAYPLRLAKVADWRERARAALALVQLGPLEERFPHQLSGGQQQRVALARALVAEPKVLLLDEPLSNLDARLREEMRDEIRALVKRIGVTVIVVTHDQEEAMGLADRVAVLNGGLLEQHDPPERLYREPASRFVAEFLGTLNEIPAERVGPACARVGRIEIAARPVAGLAPQASCRLAFRPEAVEVNGPDGPGLACQIVARVFLGAQVRYRVTGDGWSGVIVGPDGLRVGELVRVLPQSGLMLSD